MDRSDSGVSRNCIGDFIFLFMFKFVHVPKSNTLEVQIGFNRYIKHLPDPPKEGRIHTN